MSADDIFSQERAKLEKIMQAFYKRHAPNHPGNAIDVNDPDIASILSSFAYLFTNVSTFVNTSHNDFAQLMSNSILGSLIKDKPCCALINVKEGINEPTIVKKGTKISSNKMTQKGDELLYSVAHDTTLYPFYFTNFSFAEKSGLIQIKFKIENRCADKTSLDIDYLNISFSASKDQTDNSRLFLLFYMATLFELETNYGKVIPISNDDFFPYSYSSAESLFDVPAFELEDTALVMDYCKLPSKLFSFRLMVTPQILEAFRTSDQLSLVVYLPMQLKRFFPNESSFQNSLSFNIVPVVNIFEEKTVPVRINHYNNIIPLSIAGSNGDLHIYNVNQVIGIEVNTNATRQYFDFNDYIKNSNKKALVYNVRTGGTVNAPKYSLQLSYGDEEDIFVKETVVATVMCSNGAQGQIEPNTLVGFKSEKLSHIIFSQDSPSSEYTPPLLNIGQLAIFASELKVSKLDLDNLDNLKQVLTHLFTLGGATNFDRILAIQDFFWKHGSHIDDGKLIHGQEISMIINMKAFDNEIGELLIFGNVLANIFATHSPINFYSRITFYSSSNPAFPILTLPPISGDRVLQRSLNTKV